MKLKFYSILLFICINFIQVYAFNISSAKPPESFVTSLSNIRHIVSSSINNRPVLFVSSLTGEVACYTTTGAEIWKASTENNNALIFQITTGDIDNDGQDEFLAVSADGYVQCWDKAGKKLWVFKTPKKVRLAQLAVAKTNNGSFVFTGGNNNTLYKIDQKGKLVGTQKYVGSLGRLYTGNFTGDKESLLMLTYVHDKFNFEFMGLIDPENLEVINKLNKKKKVAELKGMITDLKVSDIDKDGKDDILFFISGGDGSFSPCFTALNSDFSVIAKYTIDKGDKKLRRASKFRYAHNTGFALTPVKNQIMFQFGRITYLIDTKGNLIGTDGSEDKNIHFSTYGMCMVPKEKKVYLAGEVSGGNAIYSYDISKNSGWKTRPQLIGKTQEVNKNLEKLYKQVTKFKLPKYQKKAEKPWVISYGKDIPSEVKKLKGAEMILTSQSVWSEKTDRSEIVKAIGKIGNKRDKRKKYNLTQADILKKAKQNEKKNQPFTIWAGHGSDPFITSIETIEKILEVAPNTCYGFIYAEMANTKDPRSHYFVKEYMPRLAKACRKNGRAKLFFRYKQMFWAKDVYEKPWSDLFLSKKYADILVPCTEDTNSFTQDLNLAGRIGLKFGGYVDDFGMRLIDDNVTGWRPFAPGGQKSISGFLRSGVMRAAYGARYGVVYNFPNTEQPQLNLLWALMKSGVIPQVDRNNIASIGSWHLIDGIDESMIHEHGAGHNIDSYKENDYQAVMNITSTAWAGASVPEYDLSKFLGVDYRWTNFVPTLPYGMIPIAPIETKNNLEANKVPFTISNHKFGYVNGKKIDAKEFKSTLSKVSTTGITALPINVEGAAWSAIKLDKSHIRLILIDPGYITPKDIEATITFNKTVKGVVDILSKKRLGVQNKIQVQIPAGSMRFIDVTF